MITETVRETMEPEERRDLRAQAVYHATILHAETGANMEEYMRDEVIDGVLRTATRLYNWVISDA